MYKLVVFDLDGTVANTLEDLANAVNIALSENGLPTHNVEEYRYLVGNGADRLIRLAVGDGCTDELFGCVKARFSEYYNAHSRDCTKPYDGVAELLARLSAQGVRTAVLSNKPHDFVPQILHDLYPDHTFDYMWGQQSAYERKPSPQSLNAMISLCNVKKQDVIYVGDSDVDVMTAHNAGVEVIGVEWGFRGKNELVSAGADYIAGNTDELFDIITK